ncbi:hypothetical protein ACT1U9_18880 [Streptomyces sp. BR1]|uniref:hypothetical protein n=1 Tax=Streptomyces sp. BR1 TaxID=1592323 RepID=UPI00402B103D
MALVTAVLLLFSTLAAASASADDGKPVVTLAQKEAAKGADLTVSGTGWRPGALLMLLVCGQSSPSTGVIGGTNSCANADGRAVTTDAKGAFSKPVPVAAPPKPCPCVVHVATVTGEQDAVDAELTITGHPVAPLPTQTDGGRLAVLTTPDLRGSGGILTWFGAPPSRTLVLTVGNLGSAPVKDPVFQLGTSHGVFAPQWEDRQWKGTINPGQKAEVKLGFELSAGAHGDYQVSVKYAQKVLATQPWGVGRPWGVTLFWILLCLVVPAAVFRIGMAVVDKVRPSGAGHARRGRGGRGGGDRDGVARADGGRAGGARAGGGRVRLRLPVRRAATDPARPRPGANGIDPRPGTADPATDPRAPTATTRLPWFTQDSAPTEKSPNTPTTKGNP